MSPIEGPVETGYRKMYSSIQLPSSLMIFQPIDSENSPSILSFAFFLPSFASLKKRGSKLAR